MKLEVLWRQLAGIGAEHLILHTDGNVRADSLAVGEIDGAAYRIHYQIECDAGWGVKMVLVEDLLSKRSLKLSRSEAGDWIDNHSVIQAALRGCTDVDIMITPLTNTLPIKRLNLRTGEAREIAVVYIAIPDLLVSRIEQRYTCLARDENGGTYRYENLKSDFTAELKVDTDGLVVEYPGIFVMDAKHRPSS